MSFADVQARQLVLRTLELTSQMVETDEISIERFVPNVGLLHSGIGLTDLVTQQKVYALVYVVLSETKADIEKLTIGLQALGR